MELAIAQVVVVVGHAVGVRFARAHVVAALTRARIANITNAARVAVIARRCVEYEHAATRRRARVGGAGVSVITRDARARTLTGLTNVAGRTRITIVAQLRIRRVHALAIRVALGCRARVAVVDAVRIHNTG